MMYAQVSIIFLKDVKHQMLTQVLQEMQRKQTQRTNANQEYFPTSKQVIFNSLSAGWRSEWRHKCISRRVSGLIASPLPADAARKLAGLTHPPADDIRPGWPCFLPIFCIPRINLKLLQMQWMFISDLDGWCGFITVTSIF